MMHSRNVTTSSSEETCSGYRSREPGDSWSRDFRCKRPVKADGLCAQHLAGRQRRKAVDDRHRGEREASQANQAKATEGAERLVELGITAKEHFDWRTGRYSGLVLVDAEEVMKKLRTSEGG